MGSYGDWYDKSRRRYGSDGKDVTKSGYSIDNPTDKDTKAAVTYHAVKQAFMSYKMGQDWTQRAVARPEGSAYYQWLQSDIGEGELTIGDQQSYLRPGEGIQINRYTVYA